MSLLTLHWQTRIAFRKHCGIDPTVHARAGLHCISSAQTESIQPRESPAFTCTLAYCTSQLVVEALVAQKGIDMPERNRDVREPHKAAQDLYWARHSGVIHH